MYQFVARASALVMMPVATGLSPTASYCDRGIATEVIAVNGVSFG